MSEGIAFKQVWVVGFHQHHLTAIGWNCTGGFGKGEWCCQVNPGPSHQQQSRAIRILSIIPV